MDEKRKQEIEDEEKLRQKIRKKQKSKEQFGCLAVFIIFMIISFIAIGKWATSKTSPTVEIKTLDASVRTVSDIPGIEITNNENVSWNDCKLSLNNDYGRTPILKLEPHSPLNNPYSLFTKDDGTRFNILLTKPKSVLISCQVNGVERTGFYSF